MYKPLGTALLSPSGNYKRDMIYIVIRKKDKKLLHLHTILGRFVLGRNVYEALHVLYLYSSFVNIFCKKRWVFLRF